MQINKVIQETIPSNTITETDSSIHLAHLKHLSKITKRRDKAIEKQIEKYTVKSNGVFTQAHISALNEMGFRVIVGAKFIKRFKYAVPAYGVAYQLVHTPDSFRTEIYYAGDIPEETLNKIDLLNNCRQLYPNTFDSTPYSEYWQYVILSFEPLPIIKFDLPQCDPVLIAFPLVHHRHPGMSPEIIINNNAEITKLKSIFEGEALLVSIWDYDKEIEVLG